MKSIYVSNAEIKKTLSKSGIWILCMLLAVVLVLSALFFKPENRKLDQFILTGTETAEIRNKFLNAKADNFDLTQDSLTDYLDNYSTTNSAKTEIISLVDLYFDKIDNYVTDYLGVSRDDLFVLGDDRTQVYNAVRTMKTKIFELLDSANSENPIYCVLTPKTNYTSLKALLATLENLFLPSAPNTAEQHQSIITAYRSVSNNYAQRIINAIDNLYFPTISASVLTNLEEKEAIFNARLVEIIGKMNSLMEDINSPEKTEDEKTAANTSVQNRNIMTDYADEYYQTIKTYSNLLTKTIKIEVVDEYKNEITSLKYMENYDRYAENESLSVYQFLFDNNKNINDYALNFKMGTTSNAEKNAYDFAFFAMEIFAFLILIYAIMTAASSIASENNAGTMKFVAIRPVTRTNIYYGKFISNLFMCLIMLVFATAVSFIVGGVLYSMNSLPILSVINATKVMVCHPMVLFLSYIFSLLLKLVVYITFAMMLSCLLKNGVVAITLGISFYFVNMIIGVVSGTASWMRFYPFANLNIYNYFGSLSTATDNIISKLFGSQIISSTNLLWPIISIIALIFVFNFVGLLAFRKRDMQ